MDNLPDSLPKQFPIIGIYTQIYHNKNKMDQKKQILDSQQRTTYIAASYIKFLQMSGAQVVPIFAYSKSTEYFDKLLPKLNGVFFPGGGRQINITNLWTKNAQYILQYAKKQNKKGNVFPIWGTCLGWQLIAYLTSGYNKDCLQIIQNQAGILNTLHLINKDSYMFKDFPLSVLQKLQNNPGISFFFHKKAVTKSFSEKNEIFRNFWNVNALTTSTSTMQEKRTFVSAAQAKEFPFYGIQFHPQKNPFEWKVNADRSYQGVQMAQILSNKFIEVAKKSKNSFSEIQQFYKTCIYNYKPIYNTKDKGFTQIYKFKESINIKNASQQPLHE